MPLKNWCSIHTRCYKSSLKHSVWFCAFFPSLKHNWQQHPTRHQLYGHLPPITKTIQVRRTRHAGHCWRSRDELIRDVLSWIPTHGRAKAGRPARTYIQQLCEDTGCCPEDLPRAMNDREEWRERVRDIRAASTIWWWWLLHIVLLKCLIAFLKFTSCDNQTVVGCILIAGQSSHKIYSNNMVNFQFNFSLPTIILNVHTKKSGNLSYAPRTIAFLVFRQGLRTCLSFRFLRFSLNGPPGRQSPQFDKFSFVVVIVVDYLKVCTHG